MKKILLVLLLFISISICGYGQTIDTANWSLIANSVDGKYTQLTNRNTYYGISAGSVKINFYIEAGSLDTSKFQMVPNQTDGKYNQATNKIIYYGKAIGTVKASVILDGSSSIDTASWAISYSNGYYSQVLNRTSFWGLSAGTVRLNILYNSTGSLPVLTANSIDVNYAPYNKTIKTDSINLKSTDASTFSDFIMLGNQWRIRQAGTIDTVQLYCGSVASITNAYIVVWRSYDGGVTFTKIGSSNDITSSLSNGTVTIKLTRSIPCKEGDYYGIRMKTSAVAFSGATGGVSNVTMLQKDGLTTSDSVDVTTWTSLAGQCVNINLFGNAPPIVFFGDSRISGSGNSLNVHYSYLETTSNEHLDCPITYKICNKYNIVYQNMGKGGDLMSSMKTRFFTDVTSLHPKVCWMLVDVNDLAASTSLATLETNALALNDSCTSHGITPVWMLGVGWTNGTTAQMRRKDSLETYIKTLSNQWVDCTPTAIFRSGGDVNNLWDIKVADDATDGVHFSNQGYYELGTCNQTKLASLYSVSTQTLTYYQPILDSMRTLYFTEPSYSRMYLNDSLIMNLTNDGLWSKIQAFCVLAQQNIYESEFDWKRKIVVTDNGNTFTVDRGTKSTGTTWLDTKYNPTSAGTISLNNFGFGYYVRTLNSASTWDMGVKDGANYSILLCRFGGATTYWAVNQTSLGSIANANGTGLFSTGRIVSDSAYICVNGVSLSMGAPVVSNALPNRNMYLCCYNNGGTAASFTARQYPLFFMTTGLTTAENLLLYTRISAYLGRYGAN